MDEGLDDADAHLVVGRLLFVVDGDQVQVDHDEDVLNLELADKLLQDLAQLEQALNDEAG